MSVKTVRIGARGSKLSQIQAQSVLEKLREAAPQFSYELLAIKTSGDIDQHSSLSALGGEGLFVKELEAALGRREIDLAVHSAKDLPSTLMPGYRVAAVLERAPVEDALISANYPGLMDLPPQAKVATGSPRRRALALAYRPDFRIVEIRGNVDTRLCKLRDGEFDAMILARAGLIRLGMEHHITQILPPKDFVPAAGQGALVVESRSDDIEMKQLAEEIDSVYDRACFNAERSLLSALKVGCSVPVGAWARYEGGRIKMDALIAARDGSQVIRSSGFAHTRQEAKALGELVARDLLVQGGGDLLKHV
ncbi:MAG: hydroxymethylbilane synthase [bacterium]|nr:hydroxymethylbilane synthase [bacterium]